MHEKTSGSSFLMLKLLASDCSLEWLCSVRDIYIVGGRNGLRTLNTVDSYDPSENSWESIPPMCSYRHGVGVSTMSGPMYAVGGHDGWSYLSSVER